MAFKRVKRNDHARPSAGPRPPARPWDVLYAQAQAELGAYLEHAYQQGLLTDVDIVRIAGALEHAATDPARYMPEVIDTLRREGGAAFVHRSGQRDLPVRRSRHLLGPGIVRLGVVTDEPRNPDSLQGCEFGIDKEMLRTSMLCVGPPGSGKTWSFAKPIVEHLALQALANQASVVVIDPKGDDFDTEGLFDVCIDLSDPDGSTMGFDLYGGAEAAEEAADRLASALLPVGTSADRAYFMDAARNALYQAIAPFHAAHGTYPTVRQLLELLRGDARSWQSLRDRLKNKGLIDTYGDLLAARADQKGRRDDPAAGLAERIGLLNRPALVKLLDEKTPKFRMADINEPIRVRFAVPEGRFPEASRILARLAVAQFVQVASAPSANASIYKGLVIDEAARYIDDYVALGTQRIRSRNAGLILLTQSLGDFPDEKLLKTIWSSAGCKAVFAGVDPDTAAYYARYWGTHWADELTLSRTLGTSQSATRTKPSRTWGPASYSTTFHGKGHTEGTAETAGISIRQVERDLWSPSEIINDIPPGHAVISLARPDGNRVPATLVNLRT